MNTWVNKIAELSWKSLSTVELNGLMFISCHCALEFWSSLHTLLEEFPKHDGVRRVVESEHGVTGLSFADYPDNNLSGFAAGHAQYLWHFAVKWSLLESIPDGPMFNTIARECAYYAARVASLPQHVRAMSVVSRERELPKIFEEILEGNNQAWELGGEPLAAFRHFLEAHIRLDSATGGHADLVADLRVTDEVEAFWELRHQLYTRALPTLLR